MHRFLPITEWLPKYPKAFLSGDLAAGLTVGIMLVPQGMAYALIAGLPVQYGLYASLVPQIVYALTGTSRQLAVGPVAMDSLLVASGLAALGTASISEYIGLAILLSLMMGVLQFALGLLRMGFLVNFLSRPVISGFTSAAALIIGLNQLKYLLGVDIARSNQVHLLVADAAQKVGDTHAVTLVIGALGIVLLLAVKRWVPKLPGALLVVIGGVLVAYFLPDSIPGVALVGEVPGGLPAFEIPTLDPKRMMDLMPIAATLALIAFMEAISVAKAVEERHDDYQVEANQELRALGLANIVGSLFQSYPTTGGFSRTAVNDQAGARTGLAALVAAAVVALVLLFVTAPFQFLPKAVLAAIIMTAVFKLVDWKYPIQLWKTRRDEFVLLLFTFLVTAGVGIVEGIASGAVLGLLFMVYRTARPHVAVLGNIQGFYKNIERFPDAKIEPEVLAVRFDGQLYYANMGFFRSTLNRLVAEKGDALKLVVINAESINYIDATAAHQLHKWLLTLQDKGIEIRMSGVIGPVRDLLHRMGLADVLGEEGFFVRTSGAVEGQTADVARRIATQHSND